MRLNSVLDVSFNILKENFEKLKFLAPNNKIIFMVKGDAYGHGLIPIAKFVENESLAESFGVASLGEAQVLRESGIKSRILVFSDTEVHTQLPIFEKLNLVPVLSSLSHVQKILEFKSNSIPIVLKFNTGMNRLGIDSEELESLIQILKSNGVDSIDHIMTHFSHSYFKIKDSDKTQRQYLAFKNIKTKLRSHFNIKESSVSNSGAIEQKFGLDETHIRPGLMLYGPASVGAYKKEQRLWEGEIISRFESNIISIKKVNKGDPVGYGGSVCPASGTILTLPIGYADGLLTFYAGLRLHHKAHEIKIHGRINMDLASLFTTSDTDNFKIGEKVEIWNHTQDSMTDLCTQVKTIPYQVFTALTTRVPRIYSDK